MKMRNVRPRAVNTARPRVVNIARPNLAVVNAARENQTQVSDGLGPQRHMTGNMSNLSDFKEFNRGYVTFGDEQMVAELLVKKLLKLKFITEIENLVDKKVKVIRCDNGTEFKNSVLNDFCTMKGIRREFSVARTPSQNGGSMRRNKTLIEAARTMLADSKLPTTFWAEAVNIACYVQNRTLVVKPHNKTPYELFRGRPPALSFMRPFGCHVTILNTLDHLGKFDGKTDEGYFVRYSTHCMAFMVYNIRTRRVEENLHIEFLENKPIVASAGPISLFDIDMLTKSMNYVPVIAGTNFDDFAGTKDSIGVGQSNKETRSTQDYIFMPLWKDGSPLFDSPPKISSDAKKKQDEVLDKECRASNELNSAFENLNTEYPDDPKIPGLETITTYDDSEEAANFTNLELSIHVSPTPTTKNYKNHLLKQAIGSLNTQVQTRSKLKPTNEQGFINAIYEGKSHEDLNTCLFACFLSQIEPTRISKDGCEEFFFMEGLKRRYMCVNLQSLKILTIMTRGKIDHTLFINRKKGDFLLIQFYVDDIIFGSTKKELCTEFERLMKDKFQMNVKSANTPVDTEKTLIKDADGAEVDVHLYRSMIGSLMYLTTSRPDIMYAVFVKQRSMVGFGEMIHDGFLLTLGYIYNIILIVLTQKKERKNQERNPRSTGSSRVVCPDEAC
nr:hypothetical protein [Tanacetum cinerariifolium]